MPILHSPVLSYALVGGPQRHTVVIVCLCVCLCFCRKLSRAPSPHQLKIKHWNVQCKLNAILSWNEIGECWIDGFIVELWCDLHLVAHLDSCFFCCPESVEKQPDYNRLLFYLVVPSVPQGRQWAKLNRDNPGRWRYMSHSVIYY